MLLRSEISFSCASEKRITTTPNMFQVFLEARRKSHTTRHPMPEFIAVNCFNCHMFQVQQVRKDRKWNCKTCGSKQSIIKVYASHSNAALVRPIVQNLNMKRGTLEEELKSSSSNHGHDDDDDHDNNDDGDERESDYQNNGRSAFSSANKWSKYMDDNNDNSNENPYDDNYGDNVQISTELPDALYDRRKRSKQSSSSASVVGRKRKRVTNSDDVIDDRHDDENDDVTSRYNTNYDDNDDGTFIRDDRPTKKQQRSNSNKKTAPVRRHAIENDDNDSDEQVEEHGQSRGNGPSSTTKSVVTPAVHDKWKKYY